MKFIVLAILALSLPSLAAATFQCRQFEAQFTGYASEVSQLNSKTLCKIVVTEFSPHALCSISQNVLQNNSFDCSKFGPGLKDGDAISGYAVETESGYLFID